MGVDSTGYELVMSGSLKSNEVFAASSVEEFIESFRLLGAGETARKYGIDLRNVYRRRKNIERAMGIEIHSPNMQAEPNEQYPHRIEKEIDTGMVVIFGDCHYWPGIISTAHRALVKFIKEYKKDIKLVVANGDIFDGATASKHARIGWENRPTLKQEIEACTDRLGEVEQASGKIDRTWNLGNHCARMNTLLANNVPAVEGIFGTSLKDHFPHWSPAWSTWVNDDCVIKHRYKGGVYAPRNNALMSGKSMVTGHLHAQQIIPVTNYEKTTWGMDTGCLADPFGPQFVNYTEDNSTGWRSGFGVLHFYKGEMLQPSLIRVVEEGRVDYQGKIYSV